MDTQGTLPSPQVHKPGSAEKPLYIMGTCVIIFCSTSAITQLELLSTLSIAGKKPHT